MVCLEGYPLKKFLVVFLVLVVLVVGALLAIPQFMDWNKYKAQVIGQVEAATGYSVRIDGPLELALFPSPRVLIGDLAVAVDGSSDPFLTLSRASVNIAPGPLLDKQVVFESIRLDNPSLILQVNAEGKPLWLTEKMQTAMTQKNDAAQGEINMAESLTFDRVRINNGSFRFIDDKSGGTVAIERAELDLRAENLLGPYNAAGSLFYQGNRVDFQAVTGRVASRESVPLQLQAKIKEAGADVDFSGVLALSEVPEIQGETKIEAKSLTGAMNVLTGQAGNLPDRPIMLKGLLTASPEKLVYRNLSFNFGDIPLTGSFSIDGIKKKNFVIDANFETQAAPDLGAFLPQGAGAKKAGDAFLPETLTLPVPVSGKFSLKTGGFSYKGQKFAATDILASAAEKKFTLDLAVAELPGGGKAGVKSTLAFDASSAAGSSIVYSEPSLDLAATFASERFSALSGLLVPAEIQKNIPALKNITGVSGDLKATVSQDAFKVQDTVLKLGQSTFGVDADFRKGTPDKLALGIAADVLDLGLFMPKPDEGQAAAAAAGKKKTPGEILSGLALPAMPFDLTFDLGAQRVLYDGATFSDVLAKGIVKGQALDIKTLSVGDLHGANVLLTGTVGSVKELRDVDLSLGVNSRNVETFLKALEVDTSSLPRPFGSAKLQADLIGSADALGFKTSLQALKGQLDSSGQLTNLLTSPAVNDLTILLKHGNLAEALKLFNPEMTRSPSLDKPVDFYAKVARRGDLYEFSEFKGNLGPMPAAGNITLDMGKERPLLKGTMQFGTLPLGDLAGAKGKPPKPTGEDVRWSRTAIDTGWMRILDADLEMTANGVTYGPWDLKKPAMKLKLEKGTLSIPALNAGLFGGDVSLNGSLKSSDQDRQPLVLDGVAQLKDVGVDPLVRALTGAQPLKAQGTVSLDVDVKTSGVSPAALVFDLGGKGSLFGENVVLQGVDFEKFARALSDETKPGDTLTGLWKGATRGGQTRFDKIGGDFTITEGVIALPDMQLAGPKVKIDTKGNVNLPRWSVDLTNHITLVQRTDFPPFDVKISGPLDNPGDTFGKGVLDDYLQRKIDRKLQEILTDKLGLPGQQQPTQQPGQQPSPAPEQDNLQQPEQQQQKKPQEIEPEEVFKGLLKDLIR